MEPGDIVVAKRLIYHEGINIKGVWSSPSSHESNLVLAIKFLFILIKKLICLPY